MFNVIMYNEAYDRRTGRCSTANTIGVDSLYIVHYKLVKATASSFPTSDSMKQLDNSLHLFKELLRF